MPRIQSFHAKAIIASLVTFLVTEAAALAQRVGLLEAVDSAATAVIEERMRDASRWSYYAVEISNSPHAPVMASCIRASIDIFHGHFDEARKVIDDIIPHYAAAADTMSINALALAYCAKGRLETETSFSPSDTYYMKAERLARSVGNIRLELLALRNRAELYIRAQRFVEAAYCSRLLLARCPEGFMPDMRFWSRICLIQVYLAIHVDAAIDDCVNDIEREGFYHQHPALHKAYLVAMSLVRLCQGDNAQGLNLITKAAKIAQSLHTSTADEWRIAAIRAEALARLNRTAEAKEYLSFCQENINTVSISQSHPYFSRFSYLLVEARVALDEKRISDAKKIILDTDIPKMMFDKTSFTHRYYSLLERYYVMIGDYASARQTLTIANSRYRYLLSVNARARAKDMEVAFREDTTILRQRMDINMRKAAVGNVKRQVFIATVIILAVFIIVAFVWMRNVWGRNARKIKDSEALNKQMAEEMKRQTASFINRNRLILARNADMAASQSYAQRLQRGILPDMSHLLKLGFKNSFVMRGNVDVTSSCFFWYKRICDHLLLCTANSEWDGVPGAMLSMVGLTLVEEVTSRYDGKETASEILADVEHGFVRRLPDRRWRSNLSMSVAIIDQKANLIRIASAGVDVMMRRAGVIEVIRGSEKMVGEVKDVRRQEDEVRSCISNDAIYLYSSTLTKVYGGSDGRQLGEVGLHDMLAHISRLPAELQYDTMLNEMLLWKAGRPMSDDILLLSVTMP